MYPSLGEVLDECSRPVMLKLSRPDSNGTLAFSPFNLPNMTGLTDVAGGVGSLFLPAPRLLPRSAALSNVGIELILWKQQIGRNIQPLG